MKTVSLRNAPGKLQVGLKYGVLLADWIWISLILLAASIWAIAHRSIESPESKGASLSWFWFTLPIFLVWSIYLLVFWPGSMTTDSLGQWREVVSGQFTDFHPAFHTLSIWLITRLWFSPAAVALAQILALSGLVGWGVSLFHRWGAPGWLTWLVVGLMAISPVNGMMIVTLWKDIPYSISIVALTLLVLLMIKSEGKWIEKRLAWMILGAIAALTALYRHNGIVAAFGTLGCLLLAYRNHWKRLLGALLLAIGFWWGVRGPLYNLLGVPQSQGSLFWGISSVYVIDRQLASGIPLLEDEKAFLSQVYPLKPGWPYDCYNLNKILEDGRLDTTFVAAHGTELARLALSLTLRNPTETFNHLICHNAYIFQITQPPRSGYEYAPGKIYNNSLGLENNSKLPELRSLILATMQKTSPRQWSWLIWRTAFWTYLLIFASMIASFRANSWKYLIILTPILFNDLSLLFSSGIQSFRYVYPAMLISILMSGYLILLPARIPESQR